MFELLGAGDISMGLTDSMAMTPAASVSGFYFSHPESHYFLVGKVGEDQAQDLAKRSGVSLQQLKRFLGSNL
jgi:5-methyltetrahydrofolate--homocysteine methyltransferase